jgi:predicted ABC-type exoprotein transport system permease subunit
MMDDTKADFSHDDTKRVVQRAILLNEYLLRRAWGVLYLALSLSTFLSIFGTPIINSLESIGLASTIAVDMAASGCGIVAILWAFKRVRNTAEITHPEGDRAWSRLLGYRYLVPVWIAIDALVILTIALARAQVPLVVLLIHLGVAVYLYYALSLSFSKKIPGEAIIAIGSLSLSSVASIALLSIVTSPGPYALIWGATIAVWISSGVFARTRPIPEFVEERTGLE